MFFVVFEGLDGSGKSSLMKMLDQHLRSLSYEPVLTREPGGTEVGDALREIILKKQANAPVARAELLMYEASRAQHVELVIKPSLAKKKWVLCDRFSASSVAFQGGGRSISIEQVVWLNQFATDNLIPDLTVLLDLSTCEYVSVVRLHLSIVVLHENTEETYSADLCQLFIREIFFNGTNFIIFML